jgi:hypothetical protein
MLFYNNKFILLFFTQNCKLILVTFSSLMCNQLVLNVHSIPYHPKGQDYVEGENASKGSTSESKQKEILEVCS